MQNELVVSAVGRDVVRGYLIATKVIGCAGQVEKGRGILARHLVRLLGAPRVWVFAFDRWSPTNRVRPVHTCSAGDIDPAARRLLDTSPVFNDARLDPLFYQAMQLRRPVLTRLRSQLIPDSEWQSETAGLTPRLLGGADALIGVITLDCGGALVVVAGFPPDRMLRSDGPECRLTSVVLRRLRRFYRRRRLGVRGVMGAAQYEGLTRREEQVLRHLLGGSSIKHIAEQIGVKEQTVAGYVKAVYRHFNVHSRGELMAKHLQV